MICRRNNGIRVQLSPAHLRWVKRELDQRLGAYESRGLPTFGSRECHFKGGLNERILYWQSGVREIGRAHV